MLHRACWIVVCACFGFPQLAAAAELHDAKAVIDVTVADTRTKIPLRKLAAPIPFDNFRYPYVDDAENVIFIGNDNITYSSQQGNGIYRSQASNGKLEALVTEYDLAPDDMRPIGGIMGLQTDLRSFVFHRIARYSQGIYARFENGPLVAVASLSTLAPGSSARFGQFGYADVWDDLVVFNASPDDDTVELAGLYLYQKQGGLLSRLLDNTVNVPVTGCKLTDITLQPRIDGSWLVFSASRADEKTGQPTLGRGIFGWRIREGEDPKTMFALDRLQILAPFGMIIPETEGRPLTRAASPIVGDGVIAVVGCSDVLNWKEKYANWQSICIRTADGKWHNPVDTDTLIPYRQDGAKFTEFNKWLAVHQGKVIFRADGPDGYEAVYVYDPAGEHLYFVADTTWKIDDKEISGFEISTRPLVGQRLALMVRFADNTSGVYLAALPGLPTELTRAAAAK